MPDENDEPQAIAGLPIGPKNSVVTVGPGPRKCGIHGTVIVGGRCEDCDQDEADRRADELDAAWREHHR